MAGTRWEPIDDIGLRDIFQACAATQAAGERGQTAGQIEAVDDFHGLLDREIGANAARRRRQGRRLVGRRLRLPGPPERRP
ncbi:hypothetical protein [Nocardia flavorosea]|uniref:hypothetical protein n=1 Tax=Nocardia flavorosea TaxID=53429 RepID=UPI000AD20C65|nr:hypothetical protein [Nocardia flavorosea]